MAGDARVRYTKMVIQEKFVHLLKDKQLNRITVKEICELAEINRATFYKYYADPYDLMDKMEASILQELRDTMEADEPGFIQNTLVRILSKMKEKGDLYVTLFSEYGDREFPFKIFKMCYAEISDHIDQQFPKLTKTQRAWIYVYTAQGSCGILNYWISDGMTESVEEVADFIEKLVRDTVKHQRVG